MKKISFELKITFLYVLIGSLWILFSDKAILYLVNDADILTSLQSYKGWFYVAATGLLLFLLMKKHLNRLKSVEEELNLEKEKAEEHSELKSAFISNISHEIRTPMNSIIGFSDLLNVPFLTDEKRLQYSRYISKNSKQLLSIVNNLLDISRIETGKIELFKSEFSVSDFINDVYTSFQKEAETKFLDFLLERDIENKHDIIYADKTKLQHIVSNLVTNAIKFTDKGFVKLGYYFEEQNIRFYVEDSGIGIDNQYLALIFERFRQVENGLSKKYSGTGLGLSICKSYIELMDGHIWVNSIPNQGSRFSFTIPYESVTKNNKVGTSTNEHNIDWKDYTILVAEDEELNFMYINELLRQTHVNLLHVSNGKDAVEICKNNNKIDLVLMDIKMPVMHGFEATAEIKKAKPDLPIIAQTAFAMSKDRQNANEAGCDGYIAKPMEAKKLIALISKHLKK